MARIFDLPVTGITRTWPPTQGTADGFERIIQPLLDHADTAEFGWTQTWIGVDSDPELFDVRKIWLRTTAETDKGKTHYELRLFVNEHPTLGDALYNGADTPYKVLVNAFFNGIRNGNFRDVLLGLYGTRASVTVSKTGIQLADPYGDAPEIEYKDLGNGVRASTPESIARYNAWFKDNRETTDWR